MRLLSILGHIVRELSAVVMTGVIIVFFFFQSGYDPTTPADAVMYSFLAAIFLLIYLWIQSGGIALTGVPNSVAMATDAVVSIIPLIPLLFAFFEHFKGDLPLTLFQVYFGYAALVTILFDVVVNLMLMIRLSRRYLGEMGAME